MGYATLENIISIRSIRMAVQAEPNKKGIISLAVIIVLMILVTALSNPIYQALSKKGDGVTYTASGQGYGGEVIITLTVEDERISDLTAQGEFETPAIGQKAIAQYNETIFPKLSDAYIDEVSTHLDAVSGATITSGAVSAGFQEVVEQAQAALSSNVMKN